MVHTQQLPLRHRAIPAGEVQHQRIAAIALATVLHLVGSAAGGVIVQSRLLEPSGISATSSVSHLPFSLRPLMGAPSFSTVPETCTSM